MARILIGNIKGPQGEQGPQGAQGPVGPQGPQGPLPPLVNNALATEAGVSALDAAMGKTLQDQITNNKNDITQLNSNLSGIVSGSLTLSYINSTTMWGESDVLPVNKYGIGIPVCSVAIVDGTPYENVEEISVRINESNKIEVSARGSGFVSGHQLRINYICK